MTDIVFKEDIEFENGDYKIAESDGQHIEHILKANPGQFYQFPTLGAGVNSLKNSNISKLDLEQLIREHLLKDNFRINSINITGQAGQLFTAINAERLK